MDNLGLPIRTAALRSRGKREEEEELREEERLCGPHWTMISPLSQTGGERKEDALRNCRLDRNLFFFSSQLTSNLLSEAVTIFGHEVLS